MNNPGIRFDFAITGNPTLDGIIIKGLMLLASGWTVAVVTWLNAHGFNMPGLSMWVTSAIVGGIGTILALIWNWAKKRADLTKAVQAGLNLVMAGEALSADGKTITALGTPGATPSMPVTPATAPVIIANFSNPVPKAT